MIKNVTRTLALGVPSFLREHTSRPDVCVVTYLHLATHSHSNKHFLFKGYEQTQIQQL